MFKFIRVKQSDKQMFYKALHKSVPKIRDRLTDAMEIGADEMIEKAKALAPYDDGDLEESIDWKWVKSTTLSKKQSPQLRIFAGAEKNTDDAFYARWVEFGTPDTPRQSFFFPAYRLTKRKIRSRMSRAMTKAIKDAGFKGK